MTTPDAEAGALPAESWAQRAEAAAISVQTRFGRRLLGLPGTHLPVVAWPGGRSWRGPWHYWWQAHYLDCLVDAAQRCARAGRPSLASRYAARGHEVLRAVWLRNHGRFPNDYYDDMGWLALAAQRLHALDPSHDGPTRRAGASLLPTLWRAETQALGGGLWWHVVRDFKNVAATGPAAILAARLGHRERADRLIDWLYAALWQPQTGLFADGLRLTASGQIDLVQDVYTYNQGLVLGALLESPSGINRARADSLVAAIARHLRLGEPPLLRTHGGHDGGLFTAILCRYLAAAARAPLLAETRAVAEALVLELGEALWAGRVSRPVVCAGWGWPGTRNPSPPAWVFSPDPAEPAHCSQPDGTPIELSTQVQAWMVFEAAAWISATPS